MVKPDSCIQHLILPTELSLICIIGQILGLNKASVRSQDINFIDVQDDENITAIQSLSHWVYIIQYLLWIVHGIELYVDVIDCELTVAIVHLSLRHHFAHVTSGRYFWLYTTLTVSEVTKVLLWHINCYY